LPHPLGEPGGQEEVLVKKSILVAVNDSLSSRNALDYLSGFTGFGEDLRITLLHVIRKPSASEELMGGKYMEEQREHFTSILERARENLVAGGIPPENVDLRLEMTPYTTVAEGLLDQLKVGDYDLVIIGRRRKSKAEEFVLGDVGVKMVRAPEGTAILVVKS
jgi:nucleotide-binding universal stress UspA family protein